MSASPEPTTRAGAAPAATVATVAPRRYALCGVSNRGVMSFALPVLGLAPDGTAGDESHADVADIVALVEPDTARAQAFNEWLAASAAARGPLPRYDSVAELVAAEQVDGIIVASPDHTHLEHAVAGLEHGLVVLTEKPMVTTTAEATELLAAQQRTGGTVLVTHNYRYPPRHLQLKELIRSGAIGRPVQVLLEYHVDTSHGASYFVRWNREKARSGGLTLHKSTHHLDLLGWLLDDEPVTVAAVGGTQFYGPSGPHRPRDASGTPLAGAALRDADPYWQDMLATGAVHEPDGGPRRGSLDLPYVEQYPAGVDHSVYDEAVDSVDTITSVIGYRSGVGAAYLINFSSPWEGFRLVVNGTHGQLETVSVHRSHGDITGGDEIVHRPLFGEPVRIPVATAEGGHEGADPLMRQDLFHGPSQRSLELGLPADARQGALAVAAGEALWQSAETGETIRISLD